MASLVSDAEISKRAHQQGKNLEESSPRVDLCEESSKLHAEILDDSVHVALTFAEMDLK